jgi:hypothetical protein
MTDELYGKPLIRALVSHFHNSKIILEHYDFGVYTIYFADRKSDVSTRDDLYESLDEAKEFCKEDYAVLENSWKEILDHTPIMIKG